MSRPATGMVIKPGGRRRSFALRFWAYGQREYVTLGRPEDGWTTEMAERELATVLRDVNLGIWVRPRPFSPPAPGMDPLFHEFASEWFAAKAPELAPNTARNYRNDLTKHLLPFFHEHALSQITVSEVDRYRQEKVREAAEVAAAAQTGKPRTVVIEDRGRRYRRPERPLSNRSINMHLLLLSQILEVAVDHGLLQTNPARGKRRRLKVTRPRPVYLDSAEHIAVMLEAAGELDREHRSRTTGRRAAIALLMLGGPRVSAASGLLGRDTDLANGRIAVKRDKTDAGTREIDMLPLLREILIEHKASNPGAGPDDPILTTRSGNARDRHNLRQRVVAPVVAQAEQLLAERGGQPPPTGITPHKLRHTFASVLFAIGKDPAYVMHCRDTRGGA